MPEQAIEIITKYEEIITCISEEIKHVWENLVTTGDEATKELFRTIRQIVVSDEQLFRKQEENRTLEKGTVYIVVRFGGGPSNFGSAVAPISIYALGVANQVKPVQLLLGTFVSYWTTKYLCEGTTDVKDKMIQVWNSPEVLSNFNIVNADFRNLYKVTGNIIVGPHAIRLGVITHFYKVPIFTNTTGNQNLNLYVRDAVAHEGDGTTWYSVDKEFPIENVEEYDWNSVSNIVVDSNTVPEDFYEFSVTFDKTRGVFIVSGKSYSDDIPGLVAISYSYIQTTYESRSEKVPFMAYQTGYHASLDSQPFGNTNGFIQSEVNFSTDTFTISTYMLDNQISRDCLAIKGFRYRPNGNYTILAEKSSTFSANDIIEIGLEFSNGFSNIPGQGETTSKFDPVKGSDFYKKFKILDVQIKQELADIPNLTIAFTR